MNSRTVIERRSCRVVSESSSLQAVKNFIAVKIVGWAVLRDNLPALGQFGLRIGEISFVVLRRKGIIRLRRTSQRVPIHRRSGGLTRSNERYLREV